MVAPLPIRHVAPPDDAVVVIRAGVMGASPRLVRYRQLRLSTVGRLHNDGLALLPTFDHPHFTVVLPDLSELTLARVERCFDAPIPNPSLPKPG